MKKHAPYIVAALARKDGMVLISSLLILASVSLIALGMASDTSSDVRMAGNRRQFQQDFNLADGAADLGVQTILDHLDDAVDPDTDYPGTASIPLVDGKLYLSLFRRDSNLLADVQGFPGNDNFAEDGHSADTADPKSPPDPANPGTGATDLTFTLTAPSDSTFSNAEVGVDIDRLRAQILVGSSIEFAAGYEGVGKGAGAGSVAIYYAVRAQAVPQASSSLSSEVSTVYRKVSHVVGGGE
ncbi:MAG: pilus assembly PilX N-terminal domain-containing protein [bacterium]